jgi:hypothetical protein
MSNRNQETIGNEGRAPTRSPRRRLAIVVSILFHVALLTLLFCWYFPRSTTSEVKSNSGAAGNAVGPQSADSPRSPSVPPAPSANVPPEQIEASIQSQIKQVERLSDDAKIAELEKNLRRLESIATEASVQEVTTTIANSLGLEPGPGPSEQPSSGPFDHDTAQLHDVLRNHSDSGSWEYEFVMVDAAGRTQTVPMTAAEGEPVYEAFDKMKQYPMAAGIYRQLVMPMIQKLIEASKVTQQAVDRAETVGDEAEFNAEQPSVP